ncbi:MAG: hypothetical protein GY788_30055 [bacterium]|nr:hypothetical protein [bacterium]
MPILLLSIGVTATGGVVAIRLGQKRDADGRGPTPRRRRIYLALGFYGLAVLGVIVVAGSRFPPP